MERWQAAMTAVILATSGRPDKDVADATRLHCMLEILGKL